MKTLRIDLEHQRNENHFQLQKGFYELTLSYGAKAMDIEELFLIYTPLYQKEESVLDMILKSAVTQKIADADEDRDHILRGFLDGVKSNLNHFDAAKRQIAVDLDTVVGHYGDVPGRTYDDETAAINDLVRELSVNENMNRLSTLGLTDWVAALSAKNAEFEALMGKRYTETANLPDVRMASARTDVDKAFREILKRLDALIIVNGPGKYKEYVRELNARIERFKDIMSQEQGRRDAKKEDEEITPDPELGIK